MRGSMRCGCPHGKSLPERFTPQNHAYLSANNTHASRLLGQAGLRSVATL
jgi:hypothetical protein